MKNEEISIYNLSAADIHAILHNGYEKWFESIQTIVKNEGRELKNKYDFASLVKAHHAIYVAEYEKEQWNFYRMKYNALIIM